VVDAGEGGTTSVALGVAFDPVSEPARPPRTLAHGLEGPLAGEDFPDFAVEARGAAGAAAVALGPVFDLGLQGA